LRKRESKQLTETLNKKHKLTNAYEEDSMDSVFLSDKNSNITNIYTKKAMSHIKFKHKKQESKVKSQRANVNGQKSTNDSFEFFQN